MEKREIVRKREMETDGRMRSEGGVEIHNRGD